MGPLRIVRHCGLLVLAGVLSLGLAAPALAAGYATAPATAIAKTTAATTKTTAPAAGIAATASAATPTKLPKTGAGPLPEAAGLELLLGGAAVLLWGRRRPA